jgi:NADH-ubiquinone oxidoreductase chain 5
LVFITNTNSFKSSFNKVHEGNFPLVFPLIILGFCSIFVGFLLSDLMVGMGSDFWNNSIFIHPKHVIIDFEFIPIYIKWLPVTFSLLGSYSAFYLYHFLNNFLINIVLNKYGYYLYSFLMKKWYFDKFYNNLLIYYFLNFGYEVTYNTLDKGFYEFFGPMGFVNLFFNLSSKINKLHSGQINHYLLIMLSSLITFIFLITIN